jgi:hypothetical protein
MSGLRLWDRAILLLAYGKFLASALILIFCSYFCYRVSLREE